MNTQAYLISGRTPVAKQWRQFSLFIFFSARIRSFTFGFNSFCFAENSMLAFNDIIASPEVPLQNKKKSTYAIQATLAQIEQLE